MHTNRRNSVGALAFVAIILCGCSPRARAADPSIDAYGAANVSHFLVDLQKSVAADDRTHIAEMVKYPISIIVKGKRTRLHNKQELLKYYDVAFNAKVNGSLAKQQFSGLFCNWKGIMIGRGEIWINSDGKGPLLIVAINNNPPSDP